MELTKEVWYNLLDLLHDQKLHLVRLDEEPNAKGYYTKYCVADIGFDEEDGMIMLFGTRKQVRRWKENSD